MKLTVLFLIASTLLSFNAQAKNYEKISIKEGEYKGIVYRPDGSPKAIIILYPTIAGVSPVESALARYFSRRNFLVLMPLAYSSEVDSSTPSIDKLNAEYLRPVESANTLLNKVEMDYKLPPNLPLFALGASQGGIRTVVLTAYQSRVKAAWFAVAGGDFPTLYGRSEVKKIKVFRENYMKFLKMTDVKDFEKYLRDNLVNDPTIDCQRINVPLVQVLALKDDKVPTANQNELQKACPAHQTIYLNAGHVSGPLYNVYSKKHIKEFFEKQL